MVRLRRSLVPLTVAFAAPVILACVGVDPPPGVVPNDDGGTAPGTSTDAGGGDGGADGGGGGMPCAYAPEVAKDTPAHYYRFADLKDERGGAAALLRNATVAPPGAIACEGSDQALVVGGDAAAELPDSFEFTNKRPFSVELWFKPNPGASEPFARLFSHEWVDNAGYAFGYAVTYNDTVAGSPALFFSRYFGQAGGTEGINVVLEASTDFRHVVAAFDGSTVTLYVDGKKRGSSASIKDLAATDAGTYVGARTKSGSFQDGRFSGRIDEVAVYNYPLDESRIRAHFEARR